MLANDIYDDAGSVVSEVDGQCVAIGGLYTTFAGEAVEGVTFTLLSDFLATTAGVVELLAGDVDGPTAA